MNENILVSIKKLLGIDEDDYSFDKDIVLHINTVLSILSQVGIGPENGFLIINKDETWQQFLGDNMTKQAMVVSYVHLKVKLLFDPPNSSFVIESIKDNIRELEWRLNISTN